MHVFAWRDVFDDAEVNALHAEGFGHDVTNDGWWERVHRHSLGWVCARDRGRLIGFVNVAWDGGVHAFLLDTVVDARMRSRGVGVGLVATAVAESRAAGCEWLHVDFEDHLRGFYLDRAGFTASAAGVIALR